MTAATDFQATVLRLLTEEFGAPVRVKRSVVTGFRSDWAGVVVVDGQAGSVFVKARSGAASISKLRHERRVLECLPEGYGPSVRGWCHSPVDTVAILVLEDLSANRWPPPWSNEQVDQTIDLLGRLGALKLDIDAMPRLVEVGADLGNWAAIASDPGPFLALSLRGPRWLDDVLRCVPALELNTAIDGEQLVHFDVRSDNICFGPRGPLLVDWEDCCRGNSRIDLLSWLPSLRSEGGPEPWVLVPEPEIGLLAFLAGYWCSQAGLPEPSSAPGLRQLQRAQASVALDWLDLCRSDSATFGAQVDRSDEGNGRDAVGSRRNDA